MAPPTPINTRILECSETITSVIPVTNPAANPAKPPKMVPPIIQSIPKIMEPNAPATVAFHRPPKIPSCTHSPTINPEMKSAKLTPQYALT